MTALVGSVWHPRIMASGSLLQAAEQAIANARVQVTSPMTTLPRDCGSWQSADFEPRVLLAFSMSGQSPAAAAAV